MEPRHALLIDDNPKNLNILARLLMEQGVQNTQVANSKQVESTLENSGQVDVVFLDLEMPGLNGYEILEMLKNDSRFVGVPVVAYTVHVSEVNRAHKLGFHSFIFTALLASQLIQINSLASWNAS
jgi:CheY-like chemotaxis protein